MTSKQIGKLFNKGGKKGRKRGKRGKIGEKEGVRGDGWKGGKEEKNIPRKKNTGMVGKKWEMESKKRLFFLYDFGELFKIGHGKVFKIDGTIYVQHASSFNA